MRTWLELLEKSDDYIEETLRRFIMENGADDPTADSPSSSDSCLSKSMISR